MASLDEHFRALTRVRPPDPWPELGEREPAAPTSRPAVTRLAAAAVALAVAAAGLTVAVRAFRAERPASLAARIENGLIAFARGGTEAGLYAMNPNGTGVTRLTSKAVDNDPAWSPDGSSIAFVRGFDAGDAGIYVIDADGTGARRLTDGGGLIDFTDDGPVWSPDRTRIAFARGGREPGAETGNGDIYVVNVDGTNLVQLTNDPVIQSQPAWSPDGSRIAFVGYDLASGGLPPSPVRLYVMAADGTAIHELGPENVEGPAWSPDGSEIAYVDTETGAIMAIRLDGTDPREILDVAEVVGGVHLVYGVAWSPDGTRIAFAAGPDSEDTHIYVVDRDGSNLMQLTDGQAPDSWPAWQPNPANVEQPQAEDVVYLPPRFGGAVGWFTESSRPARAGDATTAWASTIPFEPEHGAIAIPANTITTLPPDGIVLTALTVMADYDSALGPFPFDISGLALADAEQRRPTAEEPPGEYAVLELSSEPVLIRVYFGTGSPSKRLVERAQEALDTLQLPPICPAPAMGGYGAELSAEEGAAGDQVTVSGPMPFQRKDGSYDTSGQTRMIVWWNASPKDWPYLSSFSNVDPSPAVQGSPLLRLGEGGGDTCSFSVSFTVPDVPPGTYPIVVLQEGGGGSSIEASLAFRVN
jgi:Lipoprotein LpqB beta-propeller domain/WD40-like Beta Propeller Repeat